MGLARAHDIRELIQQLVCGAAQLKRWCADAHIEERIVLHVRALCFHDRG